MAVNGQFAGSVDGPGAPPLPIGTIKGQEMTRSALPVLALVAAALVAGGAAATSAVPRLADGPVRLAGLTAPSL